VAAITHNAKLNELLVDLARSLLQYAVESGLWSTTGTQGSELVKLARRQQESVKALAELLIARGWTVDFGAFPTDYTDLHFLSTGYFLPHLLESQAALVAELDEAAHTCIDDPAAVELVNRLLTEERSITAALQELGRPAAALAAN
jgi:hypothetical protein